MTCFSSLSSETYTAADIVGLKYAKKIEELSLEIYEKVYFAARIAVLFSLLIGGYLCPHLRNHHSRHQV